MKRLSIAVLMGISYAVVAASTGACGSGGGGTGGSGGGSAGGGSGGGSAMADVTCSASPQNVTLADLKVSMFDGVCVTCHYPAGYMGMATAGTGEAYGDYTSTVNIAKIIGKKSLFAGSPGTLKVVDTGGNSAALANSALWLKLSSPVGPRGFDGPKHENVGESMPESGPMLDAGVLQQVKDWICTGAQQ